MFLTRFLTRFYKIIKRLFGRAFFVIMSALFQILWFTLFIYVLGQRYPFFAGFIRTVSLIAVLYIVNKRVNPAYKLAWSLLILSLPLVGFALYLMFGRSRLQKQTKEQMERIEDQSYDLLEMTNPHDVHEFPEGDAQHHIEYTEPLPVIDLLHKHDERMGRQAEYLSRVAHYPVYRNTVTRYYPDGESLFIDMVEALQEAKHFIFLEYFIIDDGEMWGTVLDILEQKASEGVDVRLIYDDVGCVNTLPARFYKQLRERGIKCQVFNPFRPFISIVLNNRDHRKIMVVDGHTGFTGGINLADEYINKKMRFGHWKDTGIRIKGDAVWNFTVMFLQMWCSITNDTRDLDPGSAKAFSPDRYAEHKESDDGYVQPYGDSPLDEETVGENVYLQMIAHAKKYIYIFTPYLIIDNEMMTALCLAAKSGLDVRIVTPGIPDKRIVFWLSRSYYEQLIQSGVRIYEYNPGFIHAKSFLCDDEVAAVGTINLDYRSLYLHFECGVWMYGSHAVMELKEDVMQTLEMSTQITLAEVRSWKLPVRMMQSLLRLMAPML